MLEIVVTAFFLTGFVSMGIVFKKWKNCHTSVYSLFDGVVSGGVYDMKKKQNGSFYNQGIFCCANYPNGIHGKCVYHILLS